MTEYQPPLEDIRFSLNALADMDDISALPGYEDATPDLIDAILEEAGKLGREVLAPLNQSGDQQGSKLENGVVRTPDGFKQAYQLFTESGWGSIQFDPEFGGQGLPWTLATAVSEIWHSANMSFALCPLLTQGAVEVISAYASDDLKNKYLPHMISGRWNGTMNLTEPQAGSDLSRVKTKARPEGDHYRIHGQKIFITYGDHDMTDNIVHMVLARTPDAPEGIKGISLFLVPKFILDDNGEPGPRNDLKCVSLEHKLGINASPTAVMSYGDNDGAVGYLIGEENKGIQYMFTMMNNARLAVGLEGVGIGERAYQLALNYAKERIQSREAGSDSKDAAPIIRHPDIKRMLLVMKSETEAARGLAYFVASRLDMAKRHPDPEKRQQAQAFADLLTPIVKAWSTDNGIEISSLGVQIHGGMGYIEETGAAQHYRDARIASIYEGTNGIQANDLIGRKVGREQGHTMKQFIALCRDLSADLKASDNAGLKALHAPFDDALSKLETTTSWVVDKVSTDEPAVLAGAVPYLKLCGLIAGAWVLGRGAVKAQAMLDDGAENTAFLKGRILSARFFSDHMLQQAESLGQTIRKGADSILMAEENLF